MRRQVRAVVAEEWKLGIETNLNRTTKKRHRNANEEHALGCKAPYEPENAFDAGND